MDDGEMMKKGRGRYAMVRGERGGGGGKEGGKGEGWGEKDGEVKCEKKGWKGEGWGEKNEEMRGRNGEEGCRSAYWKRTEEE